MSAFVDKVPGVIGCLSQGKPEKHGHQILRGSSATDELRPPARGIRPQPAPPALSPIKRQASLTFGAASSYLPSTRDSQMPRAAFYCPGAYDTSNDDSSSTEDARHMDHLRPASFRAGKFPDKSDFMEIPANEHLELSYSPMRLAGIKPGWIIRVSDQESRLHGRVMLVIRKLGTDATCLSFCKHWPPAGAEDHWRVCEAGSVVGNDRMPSLAITLQPQGPEATYRPKSDLTINIQDLWHVEDEVYVTALGFAEEASLRKLVEAVKDIFCTSLDQAVQPAPAGTSAPQAPPPRRTNRAQRRGRLF